MAFDVNDTAQVLSMDDKAKTTAPDKTSSNCKLSDAGVY